MGEEFLHTTDRLGVFFFCFMLLSRLRSLTDLVYLALTRGRFVGISQLYIYQNLFAVCAVT